MGEFVGGRIVPKHCGTWNKRSKYEMEPFMYCVVGFARSIPASASFS